MSEPGIFVLVRDGQRRYFADRWGGVMLYREIFWGPESFEKWATQFEELDEFIDDCSGGVLVDFDARRLVWCDHEDKLAIPKIAAVYQQLVQQAWPGFDIQRASRLHELEPDAGLIGSSNDGEVDEDYGDQSGRAVSIAEVARHSNEPPDDDQPDDDGDDEEVAEGSESGEDLFGSEESRAWITIVDPQGVVRHRYLEMIPSGLFSEKRSPLDTLSALPRAEVPAEKVVNEGMWFDQRNRTIGIWGPDSLRRHVDEIRQGWNGWQVAWADGMYVDQCRVSGPVGVPLEDADALAAFLPTILSTKRLDMSSFLGAIGGGIKKTAWKATGCLLMVVCLPLLIFGLVSGNWRAVLISIAVTVGVFVLGFKFVEYRLRAKFRRNMQPLSGDQQKIHVAGPLDAVQRRQVVDRMLVAAGFPSLATIQPRFPAESDLDFLS